MILNGIKCGFLGVKRRKYCRITKCNFICVYIVHFSVWEYPDQGSNNTTLTPGPVPWNCPP